MLRLGILGAGHFAKAHLQALSRLQERVAVVAYARLSEGRAFSEAEAVGAECRTCEGLLNSTDLDALLVCTPNNLHPDYCLQALQSGKHVFCEKPLALDAKSADWVVQTAAETGKTILVGHLTRHVPIYVQVAELISSGRIGAVQVAHLSRLHVRPSSTADDPRAWRLDPAVGGGVVFDLLIHDLDLLNWYVGMPESVRASGLPNASGGFDYLSATFRYGNGAIAAVEGGLVLQPPAGLRSTMRLVGTQGHIEAATHDVDAPIRVFVRGKPEEIIQVKARDTLTDALASEWKEFLDTIEGRSPERLRLNDARNAVELAEAIMKAALTGAELRIQP